MDDKVFRGILLQQINQVELLSPLISKDIFLHKFYVKKVPNTLKKYLNTEKHSILIRCKKWTDVLQSEKITKDTFDKFLVTFKFHKK